MESTLSLRDELDSVVVDDPVLDVETYAGIASDPVLAVETSAGIASDTSLACGMGDAPSIIPSSTDAATAMTPSPKESSCSAAPILAEVAGRPMPPVLP